MFATDSGIQYKTVELNNYYSTIYQNTVSTSLLLCLDSAKAGKNRYKTKASNTSSQTNSLDKEYGGEFERIRETNG